MKFLPLLVCILFIPIIFAGTDAAPYAMHHDSSHIARTSGLGVTLDHMLSTHYDDGCYITEEVLYAVNNIAQIDMVDREGYPGDSSGPWECNICGIQSAKPIEGGGGGGGGPGEIPGWETPEIQCPDPEDEPPCEDMDVLTEVFEEEEGEGSGDVSADVITGLATAGTVLPPVTQRTGNNWLTGLASYSDDVVGFENIGACDVSYGDYPSECTAQQKVNYKHYTLGENMCGDCIKHTSEECEVGASAERQDGGGYSYICDDCQITDKIETACDDGLDNDDDGLIDEEDCDCFSESTCTGILLCSDKPIGCGNDDSYSITHAYTGLRSEDLDCSDTDRGPICYASSLDCQGYKIDGDVTVNGGTEITNCVIEGDNPLTVYADNFIVSDSTFQSDDAYVDVQASDVSILNSEFDGVGIYIGDNRLTLDGVSVSNAVIGLSGSESDHTIRSSSFTNNEYGIVSLFSATYEHVTINNNVYGFGHNGAYDSVFSFVQICYNEEYDISLYTEQYGTNVYYDTNAGNVTFSEDSRTYVCGYGECDEGYIWYEGGCIEWDSPYDVGFGSQKTYEDYYTGNFYSDLLNWIRDTAYFSDDCGDDYAIYSQLYDAGIIDHYVCVPAFQ